MSCERKQRGFTLAVAIFILVIMSLIGAAMVTIMQRGQESASTAILSTRAYFAAQSGAQWALSRLFPLNGSAAVCTAPYPTINYSSTGLAGCRAVVNCSSTNAGGKTYYTLDSSGSCSLAGVSAVREVEVRAAQP